MAGDAWAGSACTRPTNGRAAGPTPACSPLHLEPCGLPVSGYSYLKASTGSSLDALLAGYKPKSTPVRTDASTAATTE
jgi:hypothetical protein